MSELDEYDNMFVTFMSKLKECKHSKKKLEKIWLNKDNKNTEKDEDELAKLYNLACKKNPSHIGRVGFEFKTNAEQEKARKKAGLDIDGFPLKQKMGGSLISECNGSWCSIPVKPHVSNMINNNLKSANPPHEALTQYPGTNRLGNNSMSMPGVNQYIGTYLNNGPFNIKCTGQNGGAYSKIYCPKSNKVVSVFSKTGQLAIQNYFYKI